MLRLGALIAPAGPAVLASFFQSASETPLGGLHTIWIRIASRSFASALIAQCARSKLSNGQIHPAINARAAEAPLHRSGPGRCRTAAAEGLRRRAVAIGCHVNRVAYLAALAAEGAMRNGLDGEPGQPVSDEDRASARERLAPARRHLREIPGLRSQSFWATVTPAISRTRSATRTGSRRSRGSDG
jgi:hypothetical protein